MKREGLDLLELGQGKTIGKRNEEKECEMGWAQ